MHINDIFEVETQGKQSLKISRKNYEKISATELPKGELEIVKSVYWDDISTSLFLLGIINIWERAKITEVNGRKVNLSKIKDNWDKVLDIQMATLIQLSKKEGKLNE